MTVGDLYAAWLDTYIKVALQESSRPESRIERFKSHDLVAANKTVELGEAGGCGDALAAAGALEPDVRFVGGELVKLDVCPAATGASDGRVQAIDRLVGRDQH